MPTEIPDTEDIENAVGAEVRRVFNGLFNRVDSVLEQLEAQANREAGVYTAEQIAHKFLGGQRSPETVKRWCREEGLPHHRKNGLWLIHLEDFQEWVESEE